MITIIIGIHHIIYARQTDITEAWRSQKNLPAEANATKTKSSIKYVQYLFCKSINRNRIRCVFVVHHEGQYSREEGEAEESELLLQPQSEIPLNHLARYIEFDFCGTLFIHSAVVVLSPPLCLCLHLVVLLVVCPRKRKSSINIIITQQQKILATETTAAEAEQ